MTQHGTRTVAVIIPGAALTRALAVALNQSAGHNYNRPRAIPS